MSIFEPITPDGGSVEPAPGQPPARPSIDPRSIRIAGLVTAGLVVLGLIVSNAARPEHEPRPALVSRSDPGAAAIEMAESAPSDPAASTVPSEVEAVPDPPADATTTDGDRSAWADAEDDLAGRWDWRGKGNGNGHGRWR